MIVHMRRPIKPSQTLCDALTGEEAITSLQTLGLSSNSLSASLLEALEVAGPQLTALFANNASLQGNISGAFQSCLVVLSAS